MANGKMSERSYRRLKALKLFSKRLFAPFDVCCMQSEAYAKRVQPFLSSHTQLVITGNLKFDLEKKTMTEQEKTEFRALLGIADGENVILLASTHENEESLLVQSLKPLLDQHIIHRLLIAPRHPERFERVIHELNTMNIPCERFRERLNHPVIVINQMGIMDSCYQMADLVIMGGSFNPHIGGHNILEPILFCRPTLFGPYMSAQRELVRLALQFQAAAQVNQEELAQSVLKHLDPTQHPMLKNNMQALLKSVKGATQKTIKAID
ncbi:MAG: hypothetical protein K9M13_01045 [Simkaniaceae bacterium]|nr:hypothetical protein [Simkaniaceae bacterium]